MPSKYQPEKYYQILFLKFYPQSHELEHKKIKFTFEAKNLNSFSFLDVKITSKSKRSVTFFCKATFSRVFTSYDSFYINSYILGLVRTSQCYCVSKLAPVWTISI